MLDYMLMPFRRYAQFSGRSRRKEFWGFALLQAIVYTILAVLVLSTSLSMAELMAAETAGPFAIYGVIFSGTGILFAVWGLVTLIPSIAVSVRRLHDRNLSGWWYLGMTVASFIPVIGLLASIAFLVVMCLPGTPGANRFGADPKLLSDPGVFA